MNPVREPMGFSNAPGSESGMIPSLVSKKFLRLLAPVLMLFAAGLAGCAPKEAALKPDIGQAQAIWTSFLSSSAEQPRSFNLSASLSIQSPQKSARLLVKFWGNLDRPLRLDLSSGMGQIYSMWREDSLGWIAVYPMANQAFTHSDTKAALARLGMPFPFGMKDLAAISCGQFGAIVPSSFKGVKKTPKGFEYSLPASSMVASVTLDFAGNPIHLTGRGVEPWMVDMGDFTAPEPGKKALAQMIQLRTPGGVQAVFRIKKLELSSDDMQPALLDLPLPPQAKHILLDRSDDIRAPELP